MDRLLKAIEALQRALTPAGTPGYTAASGSGTVTMTGKKLVSVTVYANGGNTTLTINSGDTITIRSGVSFSFKPATPLSAPTLVFGSNADYFIEYVQ